MYMYFLCINIYCLLFKILFSFKVFKNVFEGGGVIIYCNKCLDKFEENKL